MRGAVDREAVDRGVAGAEATTLEQGSDRTREATLVTAAFFVLVVSDVVHHECWRDEMGSWLVARDSRSLTELAWNTRYVGHPRLWHLALYALTRVTLNPFAMQLLHASIATASAYVVLRFAPFPFSWRALFVFGYFPFFEYATISRNYAFAVLLLVSACCADARRRPWLVAGCLALLAQTSVYGTILAIAFAAARLKQSPAGMVSTLGAALLAAWQMMRPPDASFATGWFLSFDPVRALRILLTPWRALVPLPQPISHFWGTNVLDPWPWLQASLALPLLAIPAWRFRRRPAAATLWILASAGVLAFGYLKFAGSPRHHGHLWLALAAAAWVAANRGEAWKGKLVPIWLATHVAAALWANAADLRRPFSASRGVAEYLKQSGLASLPIAGDRDYTAAPIGAHLGKSLYYPSRRSFGTFVVWSSERKDLPREEAIARIVADLGPRHERVVVVLDRVPQALPCGFEEVARFEKAIVRMERYRVYVMDPRGCESDAAGPR